MNDTKDLDDVRLGKRRATAAEVAHLLATSLSYIRHKSASVEARGVVRFGRTVRFDFPVFEAWLIALEQKNGT